MNPNPQQKLVISHREGPCLVTAVPGSGKTASITKRIQTLVESGVDPSLILAITFTNKAAKEMRKRVSNFVGEEKACKMTICTMHSLCARIIRNHCSLVGLTSRFSIIDEDDSERMIKNSCATVLKMDEMKKVQQNFLDGVKKILSDSRNNCLSMEKMVENSRLFVADQLKSAEHYLSELKRTNCIDFDGLLSEVVRLFNEHPMIRDIYRKKWMYISVDEVQDTNPVQYEMIKQIGMGHKNVVVVGDLDQSIYAFRGATPGNVLLFEKDFGAEHLKLEINYRSTPQILAAAHKLIRNNTMRKEVELRTDNPPGREPALIYEADDVVMAERIASNVKNLISKGVKPKEIAILYRVNSASRVLEMAMRQNSIAYKIIGDVGFFNRKEVKSCLSILRFMNNPHDLTAFSHAASSSTFGIGDGTVAKVCELARKDKTNILEAAQKFSVGKKKTSKAMQTFVRCVVDALKMPANMGLLHIAQNTQLWDRMSQESTDTNDRCGNIREISSDLGKWLKDEGASLDGYLQNVALLSSNDEDGEANQIRLMTIHAAKGLEFDVVFISHAVDTLMPHSRAITEAKDEDDKKFQIEEERRLMYVGMTRARKLLAVCGFSLYTSRNTLTKPSFFIEEAGISGYEKALDIFDNTEQPPENEYSRYGYKKRNVGRFMNH